MRPDYNTAPLHESLGMTIALISSDEITFDR